MKTLFLECALYQLPAGGLLGLGQLFKLRMLLDITLEDSWRDQHGGPVDGMHQSLGVVDEQATGRDARFHPANESLSQISASARHKYIFNCFRSAICWLLGP